MYPSKFSRIAALALGTAFALEAEQVVLDDDEPASVPSGAWTHSTTQPGYFGTGYHYSSTTTGPSWTWQTRLGPDGNFEVRIGLPQAFPNRSTTATYEVKHADGSTFYTIDQTTAGSWITLGTHRFTTGSPAVVTLTNPDGNGYMVADAVRFVGSSLEVTLDEASPHPTSGGTWTPSTYKPNYFGSGYHFAPATNTASLFAWSAVVSSASNLHLSIGLPDGGSDRAPAASYAVTDADGTQTYTLDQRGPGGWFYLGIHRWTASAPAMISVTNGSGGTWLIADAVRIDSEGPVVGNSFQVHPDQERQTIWGLGVEIQFDSIGSGNNGLPEAIIAVPNNLTAGERERWYDEMLAGFRYCRLAMGLYLRGTNAAGTHIIGRWPTQMSEIQATIAQPGMEGVEMEYWSPAPAWKSTTNYIAGTIASTNAAFLNAFGDALVDDIAYLQSNGVPISMWGLQNEPHVSNTTYSTCRYSAADYHAAFGAVAPKVRTALPEVLIHADSNNGADGSWGQALRADPASLSYVDAWSYHRIGADSNEQITRDFNVNAVGRPVFNNEFEYLSGAMNEWRMVNTAQSIMNWFNFQDAPTWFWLHALKPIGNSEAAGYALGFWRPPGYTNTSIFPTLAEGHWTWNPYNWNPISGFVRHLPWDSRRVQVDETTVMNDHRILAWKTPDNRLAVAISNRTPTNYTYHVNFGRNATYSGSRFDFTHDHLLLGTFTGSSNSMVLPAYSIEFWVESTPYYRWCETYWPLRPAGQPTLRVTDPDGDGHTNHREYLFGGNPLIPDSPEPLQIAEESPGTSSLLTCLQRSDDPGVSYVPEASSDFVHWFSGPTYFQPVRSAAESTKWDQVTYRFIGTLPQPGVAFFRVKAQ